MTLYVKAGGSLRTIHTLYVKAGGVLRQLHSLQVKAGSVMRELLVQYFTPWAGRSVDAFLLGTGNISAGFAVTSAGNCLASDASINSLWVNPAPAGVGSAHQIMYTVISGPSSLLTVTAPTAGTWLSLSGNFNIQVNNNSGSSFYTGSITVRIQIRRTADNAVVCDGNITLSVTREQ